MDGIFNKDFVLGCNYWASNAGIKMWELFSEDTVNKDLRTLSENGINLLRVFPTWSFFQPIEEMIGYQGYVRGLTADCGETLLLDIDESAGINELAFSRFQTFLNLANKYDIKVIPSLITGWMSESIFAPNALQNKNLLTDPLAIKWEIRFCRYFVKRFMSDQSIIAWDLGNECNCMGRVNNSHEAWVWTASISNAIRSVDNTRPIISGMHSLGIRGECNWTYFDQAENCDILTTHTYASAENGTGLIPGDSLKAVLMAAAETKIYRGISKKPCFIEETGTYGEMYMDEEVTAVYAYNNIINSWAHGCQAYLWWLAFDQGKLRYVPYGYNNRASNYGLFKNDYTPKKIINKFNKFNSFLKDFKYDRLPPAIVDGVCVLPQNTSSISIGSTVFNLAQQAGINLDYIYIEDVLPDVPIYIIPSLNTNSVSISALDRIMEKVEKGAVLYISASNGILRNFVSDFGIKISKIIEMDTNLDNSVFVCEEEKYELALPISKKMDIKITDAKLLAHTSDGYPIFIQCDYGNGKLYLLFSGIEEWLAKRPHAFDKKYHKIYSLLKNSANTKQRLCADNDYVTVTEHCLENGNRIIIAVNNQNKSIETVLGKAKLEDVYYGKVSCCDNVLIASLEANDMVVFEIL